MFLDNLKTIQEYLLGILPNYLPSSTQPLHQAMRYACLNGGKRLRPYLVYAVGDIYDVPRSKLDALAVAVEFIHCYSLVHDDLPSMDNDVLRRGQPTCHIQFDEATAILVGDALQALALEVLASDPQFIASPQRRLEIIQLITKAIGPEGMVLGQAMDMAHTNKLINQQNLFKLHQAKTGALIQACVQCSAVACGETNPEKLKNFQTYGRSIGLAFQIQDDLLDAVGETQLLGKQTGMDKNNQKNTFVSLFGIEQAKQFAQAQYDNATGALSSLSQQTPALQQVAAYIINRVA